jgi:quinol monooxygenase YgiN
MDKTSDTSILVHAGFKIPPDRREAFERIAATFIARAAEEPGTLSFRVFRGEPGEYSMVEEYADADAARIHQQANQDLLAQVQECTEHEWLELHGPVGPSLRDWARRVSGVTLYEDEL